MGIFDMFTAKPTATQQQQQQPANPQAAAPAAGNQNGNQHVQNNTTVPNDNNTPQITNAQGQVQPSPVDAFKDLWQTTPNQQGNPQAAPIFQLDQTKLASAVKGMNFASHVNPDAVAKITQGGPEAVQALQELLNGVGQAAVAQALAGSAAIAEGGIKRYGEGITSQLPDMVKRHTVQESFRAENPALTNPAFSPVVNAIQQQIQQKFPTASAAEIRQKTSEYFDAMAGAAGFQKAPAQDPSQQKQAEEQDWSKFLEGGNSIFG